MDVKDAVKAAVDHIAEIFEREKPTNIGLEEIFFEPEPGEWVVTVGFSRPWDYPKPSPFLGESLSHPARSYKIVRLSDETGKVLSVKSFVP